MLDGRVPGASQVEYNPFGEPPLQRERRRLSPLRHRSLFGCKSARNRAQFPSSFRRVFRGPTARRGPGSESDSPPRWSVSPPSLSPLKSPLHPAPFLVQRSAQNGRVRRVRFSCRTVSGMPEPPNSQVFGGFPLSGRKSGELQPVEHVTACHRFVTAAQKKRLAKPAPRLRWVCKSWLILPAVICLSQSRS